MHRRPPPVSYQSFFFFQRPQVREPRVSYRAVSCFARHTPDVACVFLYVSFTHSTFLRSFYPSTSSTPSTPSLRAGCSPYNSSGGVRVLSLQNHDTDIRTCRRNVDRQSTHTPQQPRYVEKKQRRENSKHKLLRGAIVNRTKWC